MPLPPRRPIAWQITRRPGDFSIHSPVPLRSGSGCCCCCCLHWVGAAAGGVTGAFLGYRRGRRRAVGPGRSGAGADAVLGFFAGVGLAVLAMLLSEDLLAFMAVWAPFLVFAFTGAGTMLMVSTLRRARKSSADLDVGGLYCARCHYDLRGSVESGRCPECGRLIDDLCIVRTADSRWGAAWRSALWGFIGSALGTGLGWLIMYPMFS